MNFLSKRTAYLDRLLTRAYIFVYIITLQIFVNFRFNSFMTDPKVIEPLYRMSFLPFFWASIILALIALIKSEKKFKWLSYIVFALTTLFYFIEGFILDTYSTLFTPSIVRVMLATNVEETKEFWSTAIHFSSYTKTFFGLGLAIVLSIIAYVIPRFLLKAVEKLKSLVRLIMPIGMISVLSVGVFYFYPKMLYIYSTAFDGGLAYATLTPPERFYFATAQALDLLEGTEAYLEKVSKNSKIIEDIKASDKLPAHRFVLILGESMRPDYMHCYGYGLENTPQIDSLVKEGNLVLFSDAVTSSHSTGGSITNLMSLKTLYDNSKQWYEDPLLPTILRSAGYKSFWLSKQEKISVYVQPIYAIAQQCDSTAYIGGELDDAILPHVEDNLSKNSNKNQNYFDVIHILGSHVAYRNRYTKEFAKFKPEDITMQGLDDEQRFVVSAYSNSIYFNDNVIGNIIRRYENEPAIILYLSDHGQAIYDDPNNPNLAGHSLSLGGISIPMMIYISPSLAKEAPELLERVKQAKSKPFMSDILPYSVLGLLDIQTPLYKEKYDLFSPNYEENRKRIPRWDERTLEVKHNNVDTLKMPIR